MSLGWTGPYSTVGATGQAKILKDIVHAVCDYEAVSLDVTRQEKTQTSGNSEMTTVMEAAK